MEGDVGVVAHIHDLAHRETGALLAQVPPEAHLALGLAAEGVADRDHHVAFRAAEDQGHQMRGAAPGLELVDADIAEPLGRRQVGRDADHRHARGDDLVHGLVDQWVLEADHDQALGARRGVANCVGDALRVGLDHRVELGVQAGSGQLLRRGLGGFDHGLQERAPGMGDQRHAHRGRMAVDHAPVALAVQVLNRLQDAIDLLRPDVRATMKDAIDGRDADSGEMRDLLDGGFSLDRHAFHLLMKLGARRIATPGAIAEQGEITAGSEIFQPDRATRIHQIASN